jgi:hypothetical protein
VPDPRYPLSKQLVFQRNPTCWRPWPLPPSAERITAFLEAMIRQAGGGGVLRTRLRGGGSWHLRNPESNRQFAIEDALRRVGVPSDVRGALEFGVEERAVAVDLAQAYALSGWHIGTDLEIVPLERTWCLMLSHHDEVIMHLPSGEHLSALSRRMGVAPTGLAQGAHSRDANQDRGGTDPSAGSDEVSVAVGPGQRRTRTQAGRGTGRAADFGSADGEAVRRVPRGRYGRARASVRFTPGISTDGGAGRALGRRTIHWRGSVGFGSRCHRGTVWARPSSSVCRNLHRGNRRGARPDRGGDGSGARVVCDARTGAFTEARP